MRLFLVNVVSLKLFSKIYGENRRKHVSCEKAVREDRSGFYPVDLQFT